MQRRSGTSDLASPLYLGRKNNSITTSPSEIDGQTRQCRDHLIGEVAQLSEIDADILPIDIARLHKYDPVWVKRSDKSWTYAIVKEKEVGPNAFIVVIVSNEGATKKLSMNKCAKFLRKVADDDDDAASTKKHDKSNLNTISSTHSSTEEFMDDSMRTLLDSIELYVLQHRDVINHDAESIHRFVGALFSQHKDDDDIMRNDVLPVPNLVGSIDELCPKRTDSTDKCRSSKPPLSKQQQERRVTFKLDPDQTLNSVRSNKGPAARDKDTLQATKTRSPTGIIPERPPRRGSWSTEIKSMAEGILKIPKKKMDDLHLSEISPRCQCHQTPRSINSLLSKIPPPPFGRQENAPKKTIHLDETVSIPRKKLHELITGEVMPQNHENAGFESFQHALKSIHRRSSVFMPPESGGGVVLH